MNFLDEVEIRVISGKGGDGRISFRRESHVPYGGPDGGCGGVGGSIIIRAEEGLNTLVGLRGQRVFKAEDGQRGGTRQCTGRSGEDTVITVPVGTIVSDIDEGVILADLDTAGATVVAARGGKGGAGNEIYKTATNQTPRKYTPGHPAESRNLHLELRLLADVGVVGFPNAGKSTLVSTVSAARPRIADYPFTTLIPHLGVVERGYDGSFVIADVPGLIEGAADGAGLGHEFLRHVSRCRLLLHLVSVVDEGTGSIPHRYKAIRRELRHYDRKLAARPEMVVLSKTDTILPEEAEILRRKLSRLAGSEVFLVSAATGQGIREMIDAVWRRLQEMEQEA